MPLVALLHQPRSWSSHPTKESWFTSYFLFL